MGSLNQTAHLLTDVLTVERGPLIGAWKGKNLRRGLSPRLTTPEAKWVNTRLKPIFMYSNEPPFRLVVQSQRPDYEESIIGEFNTIDEINLFLLKQHPTRTT